jgi:hypothetical protein
VTSGTVNSVAGAFSHNFHRYTTKTFFDGLEFTAGGILEGRLMAGRGFRPFKYDFHDVAYGGPMPESLSALEGNRPSSKIFKVFRVSERLKSAEGNAGYHPIGDMLNLSLHHELLLAVSENGTALISEVGEEGVKSYELSGRKFGEGFRSRFNKPETKFEFQGYAKRSHVSMLFRKNPLELERAPIDGMNYSRSVRNPKPYSVFTRNCQMHVRAVLTKMNFLEP